jgi:glycosyltransferase involved in cell wall biosynthesis
MRPARVGLIGLIAAGVSGVPRYAASLLRAIDGVAEEFEELDVRVVTTRTGAETLALEKLAVRTVGGLLGDPRRGPRRIVAEQVGAATQDADLLHFFDLTGPVLAPRRPFVTTVHDASQPRAYKRLMQPWALRHASAAVAVSATARDEAVRAFAADPDRIAVIHSGPGLAPVPAANGTKPDRPYLLYVGDLSEHKNLRFLVEVFAAARMPERLMLVGRPGVGYPELRAQIDASPVRSRIDVVVDAEDGLIEELYRGALATVLPSRREGFGFTPLEAMARECPVVASDLPVTREILRDGAMLLPVGDLDAWVEGLQKIASSDEARSALRARGRATVRTYSWETTARAVCALHRDVLA